jgi:hypothetical protein
MNMALNKPPTLVERSLIKIVAKMPNCLRDCVGLIERVVYYLVIIYRTLYPVANLSQQDRPNQ